MSDCQPLICLRLAISLFHPVIRSARPQSIITTHFNNGFTPDVQGAAAKLVGAMMTLYKDLVVNLPPTPSKFHYIFNLRDLSRVTEARGLDAVES